MRNGLRAFAAVVLATSISACEVAEDAELYEGDEAATPAPEVTPAQPMDAAIVTAQFEAGEGATESADISGTVRVFPENAAGADATAAEAGETDLEATTTGDQQGFRVEVMLQGLPEGQHAWHIHSAPCGEEAPVVVAFTPTPELDGLSTALSADQSGRAEGDGTVPSDQLTLQQLQDGEYSLHVHQQAGVDHGPTLACADLSGQGASTM